MTARRSASQGEAHWPMVDKADGSEADDVAAAAVAAYRASLDSGAPLSERKLAELAAMFGKTSRRWARNRIAEAGQAPVPAAGGLGVVN